MGDASSPSIEGDQQQQQQQQDGASSNSSSSNSNKSTSFLQRMASADTLLRSSAPLMKRPSFSSLQNSFSSSSGSSIASSFSIPVPTNSWGMLALSRLRAADDGEFDDVIDLLLTRDKVSLHHYLPICVCMCALTISFCRPCYCYQYPNHRIHPLSSIVNSSKIMSFCIKQATTCRKSFP